MVKRGCGEEVLRVFMEFVQHVSWRLSRSARQSRRLHTQRPAADYFSLAAVRPRILDDDVGVNGK